MFKEKALDLKAKVVVEITNVTNATIKIFSVFIIMFFNKNKTTLKGNMPELNATKEKNDKTKLQSLFNKPFKRRTG